MSRRLPIIFISFALTASACGSSSDDALADAESARAAAIDLVGGEAGGAERITEDGHTLWEVEVDKTNGAELEVLFFVDSGELFEVADKAGPFDYGGLDKLVDGLSYEEARAVASDAVEGEQQAWEVKFTDEGYFYEFYQREEAGDLWEIKLWARNGEVFVLEAKDQVD